MHLKPVKADGEVDSTTTDEKRDHPYDGTDEYNAHLKKDVREWWSVVWLGYGGRGVAGLWWAWCGWVMVGIDAFE